jgi:hypothetical protein
VADHVARLWQAEETQECLLDAIDRIVGSDTFAPDKSNKPRPISVDQRGHPAEEAIVAVG